MMQQSCAINSIGTTSVFTINKEDQQQSYAEVHGSLPRCSGDEPLHVHPLQTIQLEAIEGKLGIILSDRRLIIKPGQSYEIPKNTEHAFYNADEKEIKFKSTLTPALHTEWLAKELVASSKRKKSKVVSVIERSYILSRIKGEYYHSGLPVAIQKIVQPLWAGVGKMMGLDKKVSPVY